MAGATGPLEVFEGPFGYFRLIEAGGEPQVLADRLGGSRPVVLTGGVFQNALLTSMCVDGLAARAFEVLTHRLVPSNDGGLSLGQAFIAVHGRSRGGSGGAADGVP